MKLATRYRCSADAFVSCVRGDGTPRRGTCPTCGSALRTEQGLHGIYVWRGDGRYHPRDAVKVFSTASAADRFANDHLADGYVARWIRSEDVPAALPDRRPTAVSNCQLTAEQWRVISYLYHPEQLGSRLSPTLAAVIAKQAVDRADIVEVVERGLVQARVAGEECTYAAVKRLPEKAIRLRLTKAGIYRASHDPQHLVLCWLRATGTERLDYLMHRAMVRISFGELAQIADNGLITAYVLGTDIEVPIRDMQDCPDHGHAQMTARGRTFVAYL